MPNGQQHENSDYSGYGGNPVGRNAYTQPLVGHTQWVQNPFMTMEAPTAYTHPRMRQAGMVSKGFMYQTPKDKTGGRQMKTGRP